jgi:hypothetical protein
VEICIEGGADPLQQWDLRGYETAAEALTFEVNVAPAA